MSFRTLGAVALAHFVAGRYDEASLWAEKALRERANFLPAIRDLAASRALAGRDSEAQAAVKAAAVGGLFHCKEGAGLSSIPPELSFPAMRAFAFWFEFHKLVAVDRPHHAHPGTVRFDQERYFSTAPMHPADHIVLEKIERTKSLEFNFFPAEHRQ